MVTNSPIWDQWWALAQHQRLETEISECIETELASNQPPVSEDSLLGRLVKKLDTPKNLETVENVPLGGSFYSLQEWVSQSLRGLISRKGYQRVSTQGEWYIHT